MLTSVTGDTGGGVNERERREDGGISWLTDDGAEPTTVIGATAEVTEDGVCRS